MEHPLNSTINYYSFNYGKIKIKYNKQYIRVDTILCDNRHSFI